MHEDIVELKKVELMHGGKTLQQITKFLNQHGRTIFECREKVFTSYVLRPYIQRSNVPVLGLQYLSRHKQALSCIILATKTFGISRASISGNIRRVSYAVATFVGLKLIRLHTTEGEVQVLTDRYLEVFSFQQYIGAIDGTHIEIAQLAHVTTLSQRRC